MLWRCRLCCSRWSCCIFWRSTRWGRTTRMALRSRKNKGPDGVPLDGIKFHPYYSVHDVQGIAVFLFFFCAVMFFAPEMGGFFLEFANFEEANGLKTPEHIAPVWYFTPYYSVLRAVPDKFWGFIFFAASVRDSLRSALVGSQPRQVVALSRPAQSRDAVPVCGPLSSFWVCWASRRPRPSARYWRRFARSSTSSSSSLMPWWSRMDRDKA